MTKKTLNEIESMREWIEKKIAEHKREIEFYERLLSLLDQVGAKKVVNEKTRPSEEIKVNEETVAFLYIKGSELIVKPLVPVRVEDLRIDLLKEKLSLLIPEGVSVDVSKDERGNVAQITIKNLKETSNQEAALRLASLHISSIMRTRA